MSDTVRVLHAHSGNIFGGVESILLSFVRHRDCCPELRMSFALCFDDRLSRELRKAGAEVHSLRPVRFSRPWSVLQARRTLAEILRREKYDVVAVHSAWAHAVFAPVAQRLGTRLVWWLHNRVSGTHWTERWARLTRPDRMICVSHSTAETAPALFADMPVEIIYAPHPTINDSWPFDHVARVRAELQTAPEDVVIIQVSRMEAWKGHVVHLEALAHLKDVPGWTCWQVGGPTGAGEQEYYDKLLHLAADLGLQERIRFLGRRADVPRLLAAADIFCQPNLDTEGFSIAFMEAFLARLPIVTSAIGGAVELIDETCGILLPVGDRAAVAQALRRLMADAILRKQLGAAGRARVTMLCDPAEQLHRLHRFFAGVVQCGTSARVEDADGVKTSTIPQLVQNSVLANEHDTR